MNAVFPPGNRMTTVPKPIHEVGDLDALVGQFITGEEPEVYWEDVHGHFQFHSELEARRALADPYFQRFLPHVNWSETELRKVSIYRRYCADPGTNWRMADCAVAKFGPLMLWRESGWWHAAFGGHADTEARIPTVAICLAALSAAGIRVMVDHSRIDAQLTSPTVNEQAKPRWI
jgi:hypothetical protein